MFYKFCLILYIHCRLFSSFYVAPADNEFKEKTVKYVITECNIITQNCMLPTLMKWLVHIEQGSSSVWVETNHTMDILHHTHTHHKIGEVRTKIGIKQDMGGTVWKGPRGQCMDGDSMGGNDNSIVGGYVLYYGLR